MKVNLDFKCCGFSGWLRPLMPALVGLCLGMAMSMMYMPFSNTSCETYLARQDPQDIDRIRAFQAFHRPAEEGDFQPHIREAKPPKKQAAAEEAKSSMFVRPRYASTELGVREKLFVGVVRCEGTVGTLGVALNQTLAGRVNKLVFFVDGGGSTMPEGLTIVKVAEGHPHLIPIHLLKYVTETFPDTFDYYLLLSDRAYLRARQVMDLVSKISVSHHVHLGLPKASERGRVYCHLDGGVIVSQSVLDQVSANMEWCLAECHHNDQSLNLGKCLLQSSDLQCTTHSGVKQYRAFKADAFHFEDIKKLSESQEFNMSHSVFPMPDQQTHFKLHRYFCQHDLNVTQQEIEKLKEKVSEMSQFAPGGQDSVPWPIGVPPAYKPTNRFEILRWDYFTETLIYLEDDYTNVKTLAGADKADIQEVIKVSLERLNAKYDNTFLYHRLINGYRRFDPQRGMEYLMDLSLKDMAHDGKEVTKRVELVRPLGKVEVVPMPYVTETTGVHLVLAVGEEEKEGVGTFLDAYAHTCLDTQENSRLLIVFMYPTLPLPPKQEDTFSVLKSMVTYYNKKYGDSAAQIEWVELATNGSYVTDLQVVDFVVSKFSQPDTLVLVCTVGMDLLTDFFNRVRMNTIPQWQVYFPIGFWQYKPNLIYEKKPYPTSFAINNRVGHYDTLSFEHSSFYLSDYLLARKALTPKDLTTFDLFEMFVKHSQLHIFRAVEPALKHRFQPFYCTPTMPPSHYQRCLDRRSHSLATRGQLAKLIFEHQEKISAASVAKKKV